MANHSYVMTNDERRFETQVEHLADGSSRTRHRFRYGIDANGEPLFGAWSAWELVR